MVITGDHTARQSGSFQTSKTSSMQASMNQMPENVDVFFGRITYCCCYRIVVELREYFISFCFNLLII